MVDIKRTKDAEALRQVALIQDAELRRMQSRLQAVTRENARLRGLSGDELEAQLRLVEQEVEQARMRALGGSERRPHGDEQPKDRPEQKGHGPTKQPELPIVEVKHDLDEADRTCSDCGGHLEEWAEQFEDSEEVDAVEIQYVLKKHRRKKYRCACGHLETALGPPKIVPGGRYSIDFAIHVAIAKYLDHLPLERQVKRMKRQGLVVESQTLWDQTWALAQKLEPTASRIHEHVLKQDVAIGDETHWKRLEQGKNGFTWTLTTATATSYKVLESRSNESADKMLEGFDGVLVADGYVIYPSQSKKRGFLLAHDWCHVRRKFIEAEETSPAEAKLFLDDIGKMFLIERQIAEQSASMSEADARDFALRTRREKTKPIINEIGRRAAELRVMPGMPIAHAIGYLDRHWAGLVVFVGDGRVPITSNAAERALRSPVLGRKNYLGSRSDRGMKVAGILYTILATCVQNAVDPTKYLRRVVEAELRGEIAPLPHEL